MAEHPNFNVEAVPETREILIYIESEDRRNPRDFIVATETAKACELAHALLEGVKKI